MRINYNDIKKDIVNDFAKQFNINPLFQNSFIGKILNTFSYGIYQIYLKFNWLLQQVFANTANLDNLKLQAQNRIDNLVPTKSKGRIIVAGSIGTIIPPATTFTLLNSNLQFITLASSTISENTINYTEWISIVINNIIVIMNFNNHHNFINGMTITITSSTISELNGAWVVSVINDTQITFTINTPIVITILSNSTSTEIIKYVSNNSVKVECTITGDNNLLPYLELENSDYTASFVNHDGLYGGRDTETEAEYRYRFLNFLRYPQSYFNHYHIKNYILDNYPIVTRLTIDDNIPITNIVTIYLVNDNKTDKLVSSMDLNLIKNDLDIIRPINLNLANFTITNPTQQTINIDITSIIPTATDFKNLVKSGIENYINGLNVGADISIDLLKGFIYSIRDYQNDIRVQGFKVTQTIDIVVAQGVLSTPIVTVN